MIQQFELRDITAARKALNAYPIDEERFTIERLAELNEAIDDVETRLLLGKVIPFAPISPMLQQEIDGWLASPLVIDAAPVVKALEQ
jgi:hypothetical protein